MGTRDPGRCLRSVLVEPLRVAHRRGCHGDVSDDLVVPLDVLTALADGERLEVLATVARSPGGMTIASLAEALELDARKVQASVGRLWQAGLLVREGDVVRARLDTIARAAEALRGEPSPEIVDLPPALTKFFSRGRLLTVPTNSALRLALLEFLASRVPADRTVTEAEVNLELSRYHDDYAAMRRYLVDAGLLARDNYGTYWRPADGLLPK